MRKKLVLSILLVLITCLLCGMNNKENSSSEVFLKIGLKNMMASSIKVTFNGSYLMNGENYDGNQKQTVSISNGKLLFNGIQYDTIDLTPVLPTNTLKLEVGIKKYLYRGTISFKLLSKSVLPINTIDIEDYIKGVVSFEMSNSYPEEALKAQAVAARSYALTSMGKHSADGYNLCDTTDCQVYRGYNDAYKNVNDAVDATNNQVLVYGNSLVSTFFTASNGGYTESSGNVWKKQLPYLIVKKDDMEDEDWPYGDQVITKARIEAKLKAAKYILPSDTFTNIDLNSIKKDESGRVCALTIIYSSKGNTLKKTLLKEQTRTFLSLPSSLYTVTYDAINNIYTFSGKGYGHGVGLSQIGAKNRALAGETYESILQFYYDGTKISDLNDSLINTAMMATSNTTNSAIIGGKTTSSAISNIPSTTPGNVSGPKGSVGYGIPQPNENPLSESKIISKDSDSSVMRDLKKGMNGSDVKQLQDNLKKLKYLNIKNTTNYFGDVTEKAVKLFQKSNGLKINGLADKATQNMIKNIITEKTAE